MATARIMIVDTGEDSVDFKADFGERDEEGVDTNAQLMAKQLTQFYMWAYDEAIYYVQTDKDDNEDSD